MADAAAVPSLAVRAVAVRDPPRHSLDHGAPLRLKVARQLGYKSLKYLSKITVTDSAEGIGDGLGSGSPAAGYSWYAGI
jgi:DMSO/TMAO reductase YedYZ molybdopterin-dependent catalytic subunit